MSRAPTEAGFSLVEALVALAAFAMAGVGLVQLQTHSLRTLVAIEQRALADMAAQNALVRIVASDIRLGIGVRREEIEFAGRDWQIVTTITPTGDAAMLRASVTVGNGQTAAAQAHGFVRAPTGDAP